MTAGVTDMAEHYRQVGSLNGEKTGRSFVEEIPEESADEFFKYLQAYRQKEQEKQYQQCIISH